MNEDLISRKAVLELCYSIVEDMAESSLEWNSLKLWVKGKVEELPTIPQTDSVLDEIKREINEIDSMTFVGSGSGCACEMQTECLKIINKHISRKE